MLSCSHALICCLLVLGTYAQLFPSSQGICSRATLGAGQCQNGTTCEAGWILHPALGRIFWSCGGFDISCCIRDPSITTTVAPAPPTPVPSPINDTNCGLGRPQPRILGGLNATTCSILSIASLRVRNSPGFGVPNLSNSIHVCSAVIIDQNWALTHPLCCYLSRLPLNTISDNMVLVAGEYNVDVAELNPQDSSTQLEQLVPISQCIVNPGYVNIDVISNPALNLDLNVNDNGLALLKLGTPINNYCAGTACLPFATPLFSQPSCNTFDSCIIAGWGFTTDNFQATDGRLKQGFVKVYKNDACDFVQSELYNTSPFSRFSMSSCKVPSLPIPQDGCLFDTGGPVLCYSGDRLSVQGILPFNPRCNESNLNPYIVDVSSAQTWIYDTIRNNP